MILYCLYKAGKPYIASDDMVSLTALFSQLVKTDTKTDYTLECCGDLQRVVMNGPDKVTFLCTQNKQLDITLSK